MKTEQKNVTRLGILQAISFGRDLFNSIATEGDPDEYPTGLKMTHRRYYTRLTKLVKTGLIKRKNGIYVTNTFRKGYLRSTTRIWHGSRQSSEIKWIEDRDN